MSATVIFPASISLSIIATVTGTARSPIAHRRTVRSFDLNSLAAPSLRESEAVERLSELIGGHADRRLTSFAIYRRAAAIASSLWS